MKKIAIIALSLCLFVDAATTGVASAITSYLIGPDRVRALFNEMKGLANISLQESFLRQENTIVNTTGTYSFDFRKATNSTVTSVAPQLQLLGQNDVFIATHIGVYQYEAVTASPGYVRGGLQSYVNPLYYTTTAGFTKDHLQQIYQGRLKFKVANTEVFEAIDMGLFEAREITQGYEVAGAVDLDKTGSKKPEDGLKDLATFAVMDGSQDNVWIMDLPIFSGIEWANTGAGLANNLVLKPHGILVKGGARYFKEIQARVSMITA